MKQDSADFVTNLTGTMLALGILGRGAIGLRRLMSPRKRLPPEDAYRQPLYVPREKEEEEPGIPSAGIQKMSKQTPPPLESFDSSITNPLGRWFSQLQQRWNWTPDDAPRDWSGDVAATPGMVPTTMGIGIPAGLLALYGGYKGMDWLLDSRRKAEQDSELEAAKEEYERTAREMLQKRSADEDTPDDSLDAMATSTIKNATSVLDILKSWTPQPVREMAASATGPMAAYAILSALAAGKMTYDFTNSRSDKKITEEAMRRRQQKRRRPSYVQPMGL